MPIEPILNRRSVREYKSDAVSDEDILEIIKAGVFAPSAKGIHPVEFIVVKSEKIKKELGDIVGQEFVKQAPVLIVPFCDASRTEFVIQDISVATENMFLQAAALGLGTVWKNLRSEHIEPVKKALGLAENHVVINIIPVGYPKTKPAPHTDKEFDTNKIHKIE